MKKIVSLFIILTVFMFSSFSIVFATGEHTHKITYDTLDGNIVEELHNDRDEFFVKDSNTQELNGQHFAYWLDSKDIDNAVIVYPYDIVRLDYDIVLYAVYDSSFHKVVYNPIPPGTDESDDESSDESTSFPESSEQSLDSSGNDKQPSDIHEEHSNPDASNPETSQSGGDVYGNDADKIPSVSYVSGGDEIKIGDPEPIDGYDFIEWNTKPDGTGTGYQPGQKVKFEYGQDDLVLYPIYEKIKAETSIVSASSKTESDSSGSLKKSKETNYDDEDDIINKHLFDDDLWKDGEVSLHDIEKKPAMTFDVREALLPAIIFFAFVLFVCLSIVFLTKESDKNNKK